MMNKHFFCLRGFMKSGTNWLGGLLNTHPQISCVGEFHWHRQLERFIEQRDSQPLFSQPQRAEQMRGHFDDMIRRCMVEAADPTATLIGDRTPTTILPLILPDVPHISILRDGRDVLVSRVFHLYNQPQTTRLFQRVPSMARMLESFQADRWYFQTHPDHLLCHEEMVRDSIVAWRNHVNSDRAATDQFPQLRLKQVKYEDLHANMEAIRNQLFEFLGVDPKYANTISPALAPGFAQEQPTAFFRKGIVGDWKNYFTDRTKRWFKELASDLLLDLGYEESVDW